jgi:hypothetical protein
VRRGKQSRKAFTKGPSSVLCIFPGGRTQVTLPIQEGGPSFGFQFLAMGYMITGRAFYDALEFLLKRKY